VSDAVALLVAETAGPVADGPGADPDRPRYGLIGMRERATALGGEFAAGPTPAGWLVTARLPLERKDEPLAGEGPDS
jgi:signal transduction histidine kinase